MSKLTKSSRLRVQREAAGLTREQLAFRSGVSTSTITRIELQGHAPSTTALQALAEVLGVALDDIAPFPPDRRSRKRASA